MENQFDKNHFDDKRKQKSSQSSSYYTNKWSNICSGNFSKRKGLVLLWGLESV